MDVLQEIARLRTGEKIQAIFFMAAFVFMVFSGVGWVLELFFRRFVSAKKWVNPGFLKGPCLPIYGTGVVVMTGVCPAHVSAGGRIPRHAGCLTPSSFWAAVCS